MVFEERKGKRPLNLHNLKTVLNMYDIKVYADTTDTKRDFRVKVTIKGEETKDKIAKKFIREKLEYHEVTANRSNCDRLLRMIAEVGLNRTPSPSKVKDFSFLTKVRLVIPEATKIRNEKLKEFDFLEVGKKYEIATITNDKQKDDIGIGIFDYMTDYNLFFKSEYGYMLSYPRHINLIEIKEV